VKTITLSDGQVCRVDDADFSRVGRERWYPAEGVNTTYAVRSDGDTMHRVIVRAQPGQKVDHADGNGLNNQRSNLRVCTQAQNNANSSTRRSSRSGFKGVHWCLKREKWIVQCAHKHVGQFAEKVEAAKAYDVAAVAAYGEFARLNFPNREG